MQQPSDGDVVDQKWSVEKWCDLDAGPLKLVAISILERTQDVLLQGAVELSAHLPLPVIRFNTVPLLVSWKYGSTEARRGRAATLKAAKESPGATPRMHPTLGAMAQWATSSSSGIYILHYFHLPSWSECPTTVSGSGFHWYYSVPVEVRSW